MIEICLECNKKNEDERLFKDIIDKFEVVRDMIDDEFSRRHETDALLKAINKLFHRLKRLQNHYHFE